jgi:GntR family transcriptional regulator
MSPPTVAAGEGNELSRASQFALHEQITEHLRGLVQAREPGTKLPTEDELVRRFGVSRTTVRRAIDTLVQEGKLVRRRGLGTFIAGQHLVKSLDHLSPFVSAFDHDESVEARLLHFGWVGGDAVPKSLGGPEQEALVFRRLYLTDDAPHALVHSLVLGDIGRDITRGHLEAHPIYHVLQNDLGLKLAQAQLEVSCQTAEPEIAQLLAVAPGSPLLILERVTALDDGRIVEVGTHYLLPDIYRLNLTVRDGALPPLIRLPHPRKPRETPGHPGTEEQ